MIPEASIVKDPSIDLSSTFLGFNLKYPIGAGPGIDLIGNGLSNLNKLGFEFIEIGPLTDAMENPQKAKINYIKDKRGRNILIESEENPYSVNFSLPHIQAALFNLNNQSCNLILSTNLKLSNKSLNSVPYLSDTLILKSFQSVFHLSDIITLNLSSYKSKAILQYKNIKKFETLMNKLKETIHYEMGIKAIVNYESIIPPKEGETSIFELLQIQFPNTMIKFTRPKVLLRLDNKLTTQEIKNYVDCCKNTGIIEGFVVGGLTNQYGSGNFTAGESSREESVRLLKEFYKETQGDFALISTGGVLTGNDVYERLKYGADLVLIYTPFIINGPFCLEKIVKELEGKMKIDGKNILKSIRS